MTDELPVCPDCSSEHAYEMGVLLVCPMCGNEWSPSDVTDVTDDSDDEPVQSVVKDAVGNILSDGDTVTLVTSVKVKGSTGIKAGTKVRSIRLIAPVNGHDIDCKIDGFGAMLLKSSVVKKA